MEVKPRNKGYLRQTDRQTFTAKVQLSAKISSHSFVILHKVTLQITINPMIAALLQKILLPCFPVTPLPHNVKLKSVAVQIKSEN